MNAFPIGTSALAAGQRGLELVGQNLANATTPGYHRQAVNFASRTTGGKIGSGVDVTTITRFSTAPVRTAILAGNSEQAAVTTRFEIRSQIEGTLNAGDGGVGDKLESFFNQVEQLTTRPDSSAARRPIIAAASDLARQLNSTAGDIDRQRANIATRLPNDVAEVNDFAKRIAEFNTRIAVIEKGGEPANDLRDQRDQLINELSKRVDIKTVDQPFGVVNVIASNAAVVVGEFANLFQVGPDASGNQVVTEQATGQPVTFNSGSLGALLREYNTEIPATRARLDSFANQLVQRVNQVQATGIPLSGPYTSANGTVAPTSATVPLNAANLPFAVQAGQLTVSVTDTATGNRTNTSIAIDPATQSVQDLATAFSGIPGLQATVNPTTNALELQAQPGFAFDFAGRDTNPPGGGAVANPDTANVLSALGINGLFVGSNANSVAVRSEVLADPNLLAASRTGQPGDGTNLERLASVRDLVDTAGRTLSADFADIAASVGTDVKTFGDQQVTQSNVMRNLFSQEQSVSGVNMNEELVKLLDFQRMVEGASKYLSVVNTAFDSIIQMIR